MPAIVWFRPTPPKPASAIAITAGLNGAQKRGLTRASHAITDKVHRSFKLFEIVFFLEFFRCCVKRCAAYWLYFGEPRFRQLLGNVGACTNARCIGDNNERVVPGFTARKQGSQLDALANNSYRTTASLN